MTQNTTSAEQGCLFCAVVRHAGDGWNITTESKERERSLLDRDARTIKDALASAG
ncbi:hypothetical protein [Kutzneria sp. 744]|uniref:hypothetical protein n=1 Tax=Kutzneria sp. (strain 744) TaxID=345341 RepID=UPI0012F9DA93|nr:hypothetical protein [Kutzneria sp. 744]